MKRSEDGLSNKGAQTRVDGQNGVLAPTTGRKGQRNTENKDDVIYVVK
jgi:hypothetical protein